MQRQLTPGILPIARYQTQIMDLIDKGPAVVISGKTGCGKSTQVPQYIIKRHPQAKVIVCQPRRVAATSLAVRVSQELGCKLGSKVGYHIGMESFREEKCSIVYMTYGILIQQLLFTEYLPYSHIILDEIHERSLEMDFTFVALKKIVNAKYRQKLKLVVMSATLNAELFCEYFCSNQTGFFNIPQLRQVQPPKQQGRRGRNRNQQTNEQYFQVITAGEEFKPALRLQLQEQRMFKVEEVYLDDVNQGDFYYGEDEQRITQEMFNFGLDLMKRLRSQQKDGDFLVFLPGLYEIKAMKNLLITHEFKQNQIIEVHSLFSDQLYHSLFDPTVKNKVILATNIGQSSITLPFCRIVLDFCLSRKNYSKDRGVTRLQTRLASQASLIQRSGRVGRVTDGVVYRMVTRQLYQKLSQYQRPQIHCVSLEMIILRVKQLDLMNKNQIFKNPYYFLMSTINPPNLSDIRKSLQILIHEQALIGEGHHSTLVRQADSLYLTEIGKFMVEMPCDLRISKMILIGLKIRIPERIISVASILMLNKQFFLHEQRRMNMEEWMHSLVGYDRGYFNDYLLRVNLFTHWREEFYQKIKEKRLFTRKKYIVKGQKSTQKEYFNRIYQTEQGAQEVLSFLQEFNQQKWTQKQKKWCEMRAVSPNSMRQLIKIQENLRLKVCAKNFKLLQKEHQSNDLILLCIEYGFPDSDCQVKWKDITYHIKNHPNETVFYIQLPDINETSDQNIEQYIRPLKNWRIEVQKSNKNKRIYGNTSIITKFILPKYYNKGQTKNTSQLYRFLTKSNLNHHFNSDITLRNRPITVLNESICKACFPFDPNRNFRLISHKFTQIGSKKMIAMGALIEDQTFFMMQLILKKKLELLLHPSGQYFCGFRTDSGLYQTETALQQDQINAIMHYRNLISQGKQTKVNSSDEMLAHEDAQKLIRLLRGNDAYTHQREYWEYRYQIDMKGEYREQYYDINRLPPLKNKSNYMQRYRQWKMKKYTDFFDMYRPLLLENVYLICKQCRNRQIVEIQQIGAYDHVKAILKLNQYSGSWEMSKQNKDLQCKHGHRIGTVIDEQQAKMDSSSLLLYIPFKRIEQLWDPSDWKSKQQIQSIISQGKIAAIHAKEHLCEEQCIFCFEYSQHTGEPIYKRFEKEELGNSYVKKYMEHMRSQQHISNVVKFRKQIKWDDVKQ